MNSGMKHYRLNTRHQIRKMLMYSSQNHKDKQTNKTNIQTKQANQLTPTTIQHFTVNLGIINFELTCNIQIISFFKYTV